jgi:hypothetical protein
MTPEELNAFANLIRQGIAMGMTPEEAQHYAASGGQSTAPPSQDSYSAGDDGLPPYDPLRDWGFSGGNLELSKQPVSSLGDLRGSLLPAPMPGFNVDTMNTPRPSDGPSPLDDIADAAGDIVDGVGAGAQPPTSWPTPRPLPPPPPPGFAPSVGWQQAMQMLPQYGGQQLAPNANLTKWGLFASAPGAPGAPGAPKPPATYQPVPPPTLPPPSGQPPPTMYPKPPTPGTMAALPTYSGPVKPGAYLSPDQMYRPGGYDGGLPPGDDGSGFSAGGLAPKVPTAPALQGISGREQTVNPFAYRQPTSSSTSSPTSGPVISPVTASIAGQEPVLSSASPSIATPTVRTATKGLF